LHKIFLKYYICLFYFNLRNLKLLNENDPKANLKQAFTASDKESIIRVVDYPDILNKRNLDQLLIMTYLYHMCDHFQPKASKKIAKKSPNNLSKISSTCFWLFSKILFKNKKLKKILFLCFMKVYIKYSVYIPGSEKTSF
jgi:hypothetical protein